MWLLSDSHIPIRPFLRTWPGTEILLAAALNLVFSGWNFLLQFFKPVHDDVDLRWLHSGFKHQEFLTVGGHVVVGSGIGERHITALEQHLRSTRGKTLLRIDLRGHHLVYISEHE